MSWSYDVDQIAVNPKDQVRFLVGDTLASDPLVQDEEIQFVLSQHGNIYAASAVVCMSIASLFSRKADQATGDVSDSYSQRAKAYSDRAKELRAQGNSKALAHAKPFAGGISKSTKDGLNMNSDRVKPFFTRDWPGV